MHCRLFAGIRSSSRQLILGKKYYSPTNEDEQNQTFKCGVCGKSYSRLDNLKRHQSLECDKVRKYSCYICHKTYYRRYVLINHISSKHPQYRTD
ncbi:zinc finger protein 772-like [Leptopilina boulardi]|uniref:zinc finger protein 772-like n=1 Tax=Leptopilina boulardi TaxID=63433 RepID=UPI0021F522D1|nr:zinc finger protein 772-like [Leptopilina boulardi]